jgi:hypothetical protein
MSGCSLGEREEDPQLLFFDVENQRILQILPLWQERTKIYKGLMVCNI